MEGTGIEERVEAGIEESGREKREGVEAKGTELSEARGRETRGSGDEGD